MKKVRRSNKRKFFKASFAATATTLISRNVAAENIGNIGNLESMMSLRKEKELNRSYRGWKNGEMDIHHIYTGRGEFNFMIFPDVTTMLMDAGDYDPLNSTEMLEQLPDSSKRAGEWITRYISVLYRYRIIIPSII